MQKVCVSRNLFNAQSYLTLYVVLCENADYSENKIKETIMKSTRKLLVAIVAIVSLACSCSQVKDIAYFQNKIVDSPEKIDKHAGIVIQPKDMLSIIVSSRNPELVVMFNLPVVSYQAGSEITSAGGYQRLTGYIVDNDGYIDFPENKIRMIFLNTSDVYSEYAFREGEDAPSIGISSDQLWWFANIALNFSDKADASEWGIILNSHFPLNYSEDTSRILSLLEAYREGSYGSLSYVNSNRYYNISYDFYGIERAQIICSIHGHSHNFKSELISSSATVEPWLLRLGVPNISAGRENECAAAGGKFAAKWGDFDENGDPIYYTKCHWDDSLGTFVYDEEDATSYCMITVDRESRKIYAHYVGTGRDRVFDY